MVVGAGLGRSCEVLSQMCCPLQLWSHSPCAQVAVFSQDAPDVHGEAQQALRACLSYAKPDVWSGLLIRREKWEWE